MFLSRETSKLYIYISKHIYVCTVDIKEYMYCRYKGINLKLKKKTCLNPSTIGQFYITYF